MKKSLIALTLAVAASAAFAQQFPGKIFGTMDYTRASGNTWYSNYDNHIGFTIPTNGYGTGDVAAIYNITKTNDSKSYKGVEAGWTLDTKVDMFTLSGRLGFGGVSYENYYVLQGEAKYELDSQVQPVVQYRFRDGFNADYLAENRFLLGADIKLAKDWAVRLGYTYTAVKGPDLNGLSAAISYGF